MQILRVTEALSLAFGMVWEGFDGIEHSLAVQIKKWRARGFSVACSYEREGDIIYGLDADRAKRDGARLVSGAALVAVHPELAGKSGLVILEVTQGDDPIAIVVGLRLGVVIVDRLVPLDEVDGVRNDFVSELPAGVSLETWGQVHSITSVDHDLSFEELTSFASKRAWYGSYRSGRAEVRTLRSSQPYIITGVALGVVAIIGGAAVVWSNLEAEAAAVKRARDQALNSPLVQYKNSIELLLKTPITPVAESIAIVRDQFAKFPVFYAGWQLESINCLSKSCDVVWVRGQGTFEEFVKAAAVEHPEWSGPSMSGPDKLRHAIAIDFPKVQLPGMSEWPKARIYSNATESKWQYLKPGGWRGTLLPSTQQAIPAGLKPEQELELRSYAGAPFAMQMDIANQAWWYAMVDPSSPVNDVALGSTAALNGAIDLKFDGKEMRFSFKAKIYVQN